ncbi:MULTISPECIES: MarR family winged helix-turn-helix transcriptional regulator [unclassified Rhodococcus (in: high G+C Gram-positive bacteria)]|uniref:MarR family winged helix-turn-helix transcriptional regulator n=1 Tax=unclassified Rhodococcus (in: high G+C Gram-positive bacteria) TaxID=192944 RepID=UPI000BE2E183|nr:MULTISPECIES: MarR family transcriptional regulator [unclassified Rhodococcus (in: high G+C Gram-positive bacteria)]MBP1161598.1 DNA-binding MarR family transcriptional regulator [Rhodococcus sp. PvR099]
MDGVELFLLGRTLMKIGEEALPTDGIGPHSTSVRSVLIVVSDVRAHPGSAVGEIAQRTGLPQSAVSAAVARLRDAGAVVTAPDPRDRRRLLIDAAPQPSERVEEVRSSPIDAAVATAIDTDDPQRVAEVVSLLEELARHLTPQAITRLRG